jgi:histidinol-phosphate aminotransferase
MLKRQAFISLDQTNLPGNRMPRYLQDDPSGDELQLQNLVRDCYRSGGYVFAKKADEIARLNGISDVARLASNENPRNPPQLAIRKGCSALALANRYPEETMRALTEALSRYHGPYSFVTGVGMDGVIETLMRTLVNPSEKVAISVPTFSFYRLAGLAQSAQIVEIPRRSDFSVDTDAFVQKAREAKVSFLCSPNNPTGTVTPEKDIEQILTHIDGILFLDCAYVEFSGIDYVSLMKDYPNLVIGRTMSKVFALAGARVGYAFVPPWLVPFYQRATTPFTLNDVSAQAAIGALEDGTFVRETIAHVNSWRERFIHEVAFPVMPSGANFVMVDVSPWTGDEMMILLMEKGVLVRSCASFPGLENRYIRVSIGMDWENERFLSAVNSIKNYQHQDNP